MHAHITDERKNIATTKNRTTRSVFLWMCPIPEAGTFQAKYSLAAHVAD